MGALPFSALCFLASNGTKTVRQGLQFAAPNLNVSLAWGLGRFNLGGTAAFGRETFEEYSREDEKPPRNTFSRWFAPAPGAAGGAWRPFGRSSSTRCECISRGPYIHTGPLHPGDVHGQVVRLGANVEFMNGDVFAHTEQLNTIVSDGNFTRRVVLEQGRMLAGAVAKLTVAVANLTEAVAGMSKRQTAAIVLLANLTEAVAALARSMKWMSERQRTAAEAAATAADFRFGVLAVLIVVLAVLIVGLFLQLDRRMSGMDTRMSGMDTRISTIMAGCGSPTRSSPASFPRRQRRPPAGHCSRGDPRRLQFPGGAA